MTTTFSENELLALLREAYGETDEEGLTAGEMAERMGLSVQTVRVRIKRLIQAGQLRPVKLRRMRINQVMSIVDGYAPVKEGA